jgi:hypothetical protein
MHRHRHKSGHGGCGRSDRRFPTSEELLSALEEHQKDLEQEVADVAELIRRLKQEQAEAQPATV